MDNLVVLQGLREERERLEATLYAMERLALMNGINPAPKWVKNGAPKRGRGRPPGSKNKPKEDAALAAKQAEKG